AAGPAAAGPGAARPAAAIPVAAGPRARARLQVRARPLVDGVAEDVLLARQEDAVARDVVLPACDLDRARTRRLREALAGIRPLRRPRQHLPEADLAGALRLAVGARELGGVRREVALHEVRRHLRVLLEHERHGAGDDRGRLRRAAAAE